MGIREVLGTGRGNAQTVTQIALQANCTIQEVIDEISAMRKCGFPICTARTSEGNLGLYIASTEADLLRTISYLRHKLQRDEAVLQDVITSYDIAYGIKKPKESSETCEDAFQI